MDRSNFNFVGSTYDFEKRQAFKAKLAERLESPTIETLAVKDLSFFPVGSSVWHPDLGICTILSIDEENNTIVVDASIGQVDLVLSQVSSKLILAEKTFEHPQIETVPEHVPVKPLVREPLAPKVLQYTSRGDVSVSIPEVFKTWQRNQQFMFLTRNQNLTTDQANDVFSVLDGNKPLFHGVTIAWQSKEETEANIIPGPEALSTIVEGVRVYPTILENKNLWHPDFGECSVVSAEDNLLILMTSIGQVPCVMDVTLPKLAVLTSAAPEHAPKKLGTKVPVFAKEEVHPRISLQLPNEFNAWKILEKYSYLTGNKHLTPEDANDFLAGSADKFDVQWTDEHPEAAKRAEVEQRLLNPIEKPVVKASSVIQPADPGVQRIVEEVSVTKKESVLKVSVNLPTDFKNWTSSGQYVFLTRSRQLTFNEANDIMDSLQGKSLKSSTQYEIIWDQIDPVAYASENSGVRRITEEVEVVEKESVLKKVVITLPTNYQNWSESNRFSFLTRARQLTINESNAVLNTLQGKPFNSKIEYEIVWSE